MNEFQILRQLSARIGADPLLVQAAGGNSSIKQDGVMWIKASGTWLRDADRKSIFVPLDLDALREGLRNDDPLCESCTSFVRHDLNTEGLRPSIETSVHGLMTQKVVLHVHCVNTIAWAIQEDVALALQTRLAGHAWAFVPYARPGLHLSRAIKSVLRPDINVLVLQNHGLVVAAETVLAAETLLRNVVKALDLPPVAKPMQGSQPVVQGYVPLQSAELAHLAQNPDVQQVAHNFVYYPDHAIFLGTAIASDLEKKPPAVFIENAGYYIATNAKSAVAPMLQCLADVFARLPEGAKLRPLKPQEIDMLLNWDAEKYRQTLHQV